MGKNGKERKRRRLMQVDLPKKDDDVAENEGDADQLINTDHLNITMKVLTKLRCEWDEEGSKARYKPLRALLHDLHSLHSEDVKTGLSLSGRISDALTTSQHHLAIDLLTEMRHRGQTPPLGALQRWVRQCDATTHPTNAPPPLTLRVLDAILRTTCPDLESPAPLIPLPTFSPIPLPPSSPIEHIEFPPFPVVLREAGEHRRPPNQHDAILYTNKDVDYAFLSSPSEAPIAHHPVPDIPAAFVLSNVLSPRECHEIISAAESIGFTPDCPLDLPSSQSILAHNVFLLANKQLNDTLFDRVAFHLPDGAVGLNCRWRIYRYVPGAVYRPHIDGAWPGSGIDETTGEYIYDAFPGELYSRMTFLVRLNHSFSGGETTFFVPSPFPSQMYSRPVLTQEGSCVCFPHGVTNGSLLHEGSAVTAGVKYVIRTDVLYRISPGS